VTEASHLLRYLLVFLIVWPLVGWLSPLAINVAQAEALPSTEMLGFVLLVTSVPVALFSVPPALATGWLSYSLKDEHLLTQWALTTAAGYVLSGLGVAMLNLSDFKPGPPAVVALPGALAALVCVTLVRPPSFKKDPAP
jgi:hypothetical protein